MRLPPAICLFALMSLTSARAELPKEIAGTWRTTKVIRTSNVQALSKHQAEAFLGHTFTFSASRFTSGASSLNSPRYEVERYRVGELIDRFMIMPNELGIRTSFVREVDVNDRSGNAAGIPGNIVLIMGSGSTQLIWFWKGVFFEARRTNGR
jgi:hypothetical protein